MSRIAPPKAVDFSPMSQRVVSGRADDVLGLDRDADRVGRALELGAVGLRDHHAVERGVTAMKPAGGSTLLLPITMPVAPAALALATLSAKAQVPRST